MEITYKWIKQTLFSLFQPLLPFLFFLFSSSLSPLFATSPSPPPLDLNKLQGFQNTSLRTALTIARRRFTPVIPNMRHEEPEQPPTVPTTSSPTVKVKKQNGQTTKTCTPHFSHCEIPGPIPLEELFGFQVLPTEHQLTKAHNLYLNHFSYYFLWQTPMSIFRNWPNKLYYIHQMNTMQV